MNRRSFRVVGGQDPSPIWHKLLIIAAYLLLGTIVANANPEGLSGLISIFMLLGFLYWFFLGRHRYGVHAFLKYHLLQALMFNMCIAAGIWVFIEVLKLFAILPFLMKPMSWLAHLVFDPIPMGLWMVSVKTFCIMIVALILAIDGARGNYSQIPWISEGVRRWV